MTDPISDMLLRIRNAQGAKMETVDVPHSRLKEALAKIMQAEGYIYKLETLSRKRKVLRLSLKYKGKKIAVISGLKRVSTPGRRIYKGAAELRPVQAGFGTLIISTSKGLMTDADARAAKLGGELICQIW